MFNNKKVLAVIPARAGSKRLPGKNILDFSGKPLISWTIEAGLKSKYVDKVIVSTDDDSIARIAKDYGASVPFMRPDELAADDSSTFDVLEHVIETLRENGDSYDYVVLLQATSPLRSAQHLDDAFETMNKKKAVGVISVCLVDHPIEWCNTLPKDGSMNNFIRPEYRNIRSQDFEKRYCLNGAIYISLIENLVINKSFFIGAGIASYVMNREVSIDIDTSIDFTIAECLMQESLSDNK